MSQLNTNKIRKETKKRYLILINNSISKKIEANFFNKDTLFTFWFYSINNYFLSIDIYEDNQSIANRKNVKNIGIDKADIEKNKNKADIKEEPNIGK